MVGQRRVDHLNQLHHRRVPVQVFVSLEEKGMLMAVVSLQDDFLGACFGTQHLHLGPHAGQHDGGMLGGVRVGGEGDEVGGEGK